MKLQEKINRNQFLKQVGFTGTALFALYTASSCKNETGVTPISSNGITIDLTDAAYANLKKEGGYVIKSGIVIARYNGNYVAATLTCSHEGRQQITFQNKEWYCTAHGARFDTSGKGLNSEGRAGLTVYKTAVSGNTLTITA
ncbi:ubiquinol-cytochrome c reductase iron-sulfur subunit [Emticicia sp. 21SJ11W-3]|uniref:QcrA and Rieske domain-containing protein n=1 Tax=Emticicia sp. 21SJ11W-3 TaxID=2916755 RepID=UPI00209C97DC|nr:Rieske 2Fe-2S domain-containing protein [Emticicia sp. 21SJ11W-3]UTA66827.1 Rieske 2Fe-2S domain-containing protein [Emticicia sp. 21SJ11W-3]